MKKQKQAEKLAVAAQPLPQGTSMKVPYALVRPDPGQPRKTFSEEALKELADSIRERGILQDLVLERVPARYRIEEPNLIHEQWRVLEWVAGVPGSGTPGGGTGPTSDGSRNADGAGWELRCEFTAAECRLFAEELGPDAMRETYRIVCGERRWRAAGMVGLTELPAKVFAGLTAEQRFAMQFIENNQRENITALEEAAALAKQLEERKRLDTTFSPEKLAQELGMSRAGIYERLKLNRLQPKIREALVAGTISTSIAGEIAKLPTPEQQGKLLKRIEAAACYRPMSVRDVQAEIDEEYVKQLSEAPFDQKATYVTDTAHYGGALPTCAECPQRTGNMLAEFPELKGKPNVCTNTECFGLKCKAYWKIQAAEAAQQGKTVLTEKEFKAVRKDYVEADEYTFGKNRQGRLGELMGKHKPQPVLVATAEGLQEWFKEDEAIAAAKQNGVKFEKGERPEEKVKAAALRESRNALRDRLGPQLGHALNKLKPGVVSELMADMAEEPPAHWRMRSDAWKVAQTPLAKVAIDFLGSRLDGVTIWATGEWDRESLKLWKALGVDLVAEEKAAQPELPAKSEPEQKELAAMPKGKKGGFSAEQKARIAAAQKARWAKVKAKQG